MDPGASDDTAEIDTAEPCDTLPHPSNEFRARRVRHGETPLGDACIGLEIAGSLIAASG